MTKFRGFNFCKLGFKDVYPDDQKYLRCSMHPGTVLIQDPLDKTVMIWPQCGLPYTPDELTKITGPESRFGVPNKGPMLLQPDKKKSKLRVFDPVIPVMLNDEVHDYRRVIKGARNALNAAADEEIEERGPIIRHSVPLYSIKI